MERCSEAIEVCSRAIQLESGSVDIRMILALAYERAGDTANAEKAYREVLRQSSGHVDAKLGVARLLMGKGDFSAAEELLLEALQSEPQYYHLHQLLGRVYECTGRHDQAESCYREVLARAPDYVDAWISLGNVLQNTGQFDAAMSSYASALRLAPENAEAYYNRGLLEKRLGKFKTAVDSFDRAITFRPAFFQPHWNKSFVCLLTGDFEEGWREYEWRLRGEEHIQRPFVQPVWKGEDLNGRTILVHDEQGYGDTFQFVRYLPLVKARGGRVIFECHSKLGPVLQGCAGYDQIIERNALESTPDVSFDVQVHLMSLPFIFNTRLETIPQHVPYLKADRDLVEKWKVHLEKDARFKIGICWAGSPKHTNEAVRSCPLQEFSVLSAVEGVSLYSLQKGPATEQIEGLSERFELNRIDRDLDQDARFVDTAAVIESLDLVISIDTSIVHLAGALGRPVWTLLSTSPDWRWLAEGASNPWYPTMRLFRQTQPGDWAGVFRDVVKDLTEYLNEYGE
jgi:tetratricopeptide (TPR) repeat protein